MSTQGSSPLIEVAEAAALIANGAVRVIDAQAVLGNPAGGQALYLQGHVPGAIHLGLDQVWSGPGPRSAGRHPLPDLEALRAALSVAGIGRDDRLLIYDAADTSMAAARAWFVLTLIGHRPPQVLNGGLAAWQAAGLDLQQGAASVRAAADYPEISYDRALLRTTADVQQALANASITLLDARPPARYRGEVEPIDPIPGRIPGALNLPVAALLGADRRLREAAELAAQFDALAAPESIVVSCGSGVTGCTLALAMTHAGLRTPPLYAPSYSGWIAAGLVVVCGD